MVREQGSDLVRSNARPRPIVEGHMGDPALRRVALGKADRRQHEEGRDAAEDRQFVKTDPEQNAECCGHPE